MTSTSRASPDWTASLNRHAAYIDVLGYGSILTTPTYAREVDRANTLLQVWTPLCDVFSDLVENRPWLRGTLFSDSLFLSATEPVGLIAIVAKIFTGAYCFYEHRTHNGSWMPWLRAGIGSGWVLSVLDPIAPSAKLEEKARFTNPTGPGVADAYYRAEKSKLPGMRILVTDEIAREFMDRSKSVHFDDDEIRQYVAWLRSSEWPTVGDRAGLRDVPWWRCDNNGRVPERVLLDHQWQAAIGSEPDRSRRHFEESLRLIRS